MRLAGLAEPLEAESCVGSFAFRVQVTLFEVEPGAVSVEGFLERRDHDARQAGFELCRAGLAAGGFSLQVGASAAKQPGRFGHGADRVQRAQPGYEAHGTSLWGATEGVKQTGN